MFNSGGKITIGEASERLGVEPHTLRFWEEEFADLFKNGNGIERSQGGFRTYSEGALCVLAKIRDMIHVQGYTHRGVAQALGITFRPAQASKRNGKRCQSCGARVAP